MKLSVHDQDVPSAKCCSLDGLNFLRPFDLTPADEARCQNADRNDDDAGVEEAEDGKD